VTRSSVGPAGAWPEIMKDAIVRIFADRPTATGERPSVGVGFLIEDQLVLTCAHVVTDALGIARDAAPPEDAVITMDLPLLAGPAEGGGVLTARVQELISRQAGVAGDVAVLRLSAAVPGAWPIRLVNETAVWGHRAGAFGLPSGRPGGVWHSGVLMAPQADGWIQMNLDPISGGYPVSQGFSGGPVWDEAEGGVIGMLTAAESGAPAVSYLMPTERLALAWPPLAALITPPSPYRSLKPFEEGDHAIFHGRRDESKRIAQAVADKRVTTLIGPSGCGKSSLARAGVIPRRRACGDVPVVIRPTRGSSPLHALVRELVPLLEPGLSEIDEIAKRNVLATELVKHGLHNVAPSVLARHSATRLLIVIDQFEELLDLPEHDVRTFADALVGKRPPADVAVLSTLRADFVESVLASEVLRTLVSDSLDRLLPMSHKQLREAITAPVEATPGVRFEPGLDARIIKDTGGSARLLPLLAFALDRLWRAQDHRGVLTFQAYDALGGVKGALSAYAGAAWKAVDDGDRPAAERLLLRLVRMPIGAEAATRRVVPRAELDETEWRVAQRLAAARLVVLNSKAAANPETTLAEVESIELAHEVLITSWTVLEELVKDDQLFLAWHESLRHDVNRWSEAQRANELLPTQIALAAAKVHLPEREADLNETEREFLARGRSRHRSRSRRRRTLIAGVCALVLVAGATGLLASEEGQQAARNAAVTRSNTLAVEAAAATPTDPELGAQLAVAAYRESPTTAAAEQLYASLDTPLDRVVGDTGNAVLQIATQPDGPLAAAVDNNGSLRIWNLADPANPALDSTVHADPAAIAIAPGGKLLAAGTGKGMALWSLADPRHPRIATLLPGFPRFSGQAAFTSMSFSSNGEMLAAATEQGKALLWSVADPGHPKSLAILPDPTSGASLIAGVAVSPNGRLLAETSQDGATDLWDISNPTHPALDDTIATGYQAVAFSPSGTLMAAVGDTNLGLWNISNPAKPASLNVGIAATPIDMESLAFSPDGATLAYGGMDTDDTNSSLCLMDLSAANLANSIGAQSNCTTTGFHTFALSYTASGAILTGGNDGKVRLWSRPLPQADDTSITNTSGGWALSPDGRLLAAPSSIALSGSGNVVGIWMTSASANPEAVGALTLAAQIQSLQFVSATGLLTVDLDGNVQLWNLHDPHHPLQAASLATANFPRSDSTFLGAPIIETSGVNGAGDLVSVQTSGRLDLWRISTTLAATRLGTLPVPNPSDIAGAVDEDTAIVVTAHGITWWNITNPAHPVEGETSPLNDPLHGSFTTNPGIVAATTGVTSDGNSVVIYKARNGNVISQDKLPGTYGSTLAMSDDSDWLATSNPGNSFLTLWNVQNDHPRPINAVGAEPNTEGAVFSADDQLMADWGDGGGIQLWGSLNSPAPTLVTTIPIPNDAGDLSGVSAAFLPGDSKIAIVTTDAVYFYDTSPSKLADQLCMEVGGMTSPQLWSQYAPGVPYQNPCP
jgi:WD40 repeat protein